MGSATTGAGGAYERLIDRIDRAADNGHGLRLDWDAAARLAAVLSLTEGRNAAAVERGGGDAAARMAAAE